MQQPQTDIPHTTNDQNLLITKNVRKNAFEVHSMGLQWNKRCFQIIFVGILISSKTDNKIENECVCKV